MALADIVTKIKVDAQTQARLMLDEAQAQAAVLVDEARTKAERESGARLADAEKRAKREANTVMVNARLSARDELLSHKRSIVEDVLAATVGAIRDMDDTSYVQFMAQQIISYARGGERVWPSEADAHRLDSVIKQLGASNLGSAFEVEPGFAPIKSGFMLVGEKTSYDLSHEAIVESHRRELEPLVAASLFEHDNA